MTMRISITEDKEEAARIRQAIKENGGYCPCVLTKNPDTKCMCKAFREQKEPGLCHCGLYYKIIDEEGK